MAARPVHERGFLLITVAVGLLLLSVVSLMILESGSHDAALRSRQLNQRGLEYAAAAGITEARWRLRNTTTCDNYSDIATTAFAGYTYSGSITPGSGSPVSVTAVAVDTEGNRSTAVAADLQVTIAPTPRVLQPGANGKDTYIRDGGNDSNNFGASTILKINNASAEEASLLKFDLSSIPSSAIIHSATLELWLEGGELLSNGVIDTHRVTQAWVEGNLDGQAPPAGAGATYNSYNGQNNWANPGGDYESTPLDTVTIPTLTQAWYSWDIAAAVAGWLDGNYDNEGVLLRASAGNVQKIWFTSGDGTASLRPRLTVTYACECGGDCSAAGSPGEPVAHWKLDDGGGIEAEDSAGGHTGLLENGPAWSMGGKLDGALDFDGIDDRIVVPHEDSLNLTSVLSFSAWVKFHSFLAGDYRILSKETPGQNDNYWFGLQDNQLSMGIAGELFSSSMTLSANRWYHVAATFDSAADEVTMYIDGTERLVATTTATITPNSEALFVGANWEADTYWNGLLDDVRIHNHVLSRSEIVDQAHVPTYCDAAYAPDNKVSSFSSAGSGYVFGRGITYFPEGRTLGAATAPAGGAWIAVGDSGKLAMTDMSGTVLDDTFDTGLPGFHGITYLRAGEHAGKFVAVLDSSLYLIDPMVQPATASVTTIDMSSLVSSGKGVTYIDGGSYDKHVAVVDTTNMEIYVLDQEWNEAQTINLGGITGNAEDVAHVDGTDNFLVMNASNDQVIMIDATETLGLSYDVAQFGYDNPASIAIHPISCQHLISDNIADEYAYLNVEGSGTGPGYVESYSPWVADEDDEWEVVGLAGYGVPANAVVEVAIVNSDDEKQRFGGVRAVGSTLSRRLLLHEAESGGTDVMVMHAQTDASSRIEHYADDDEKVSFVLLGYWSIGEYVETIDLFSAGANNAWQSRALSAYGVSPGDVVDLMVLNLSRNTEFEVGVRTSGSTTQRKIDIHEAESGGRDMVAMSSIAGADGGATIELFAQNSGSTDFYLTGYWSDPPGTYTESFLALPGAPSASGAWDDADASSFGPPARSVLQIVMANGNDSSEAQLGVRGMGSTYNRLLNLQEAESGGDDLGSMHVKTDEATAFQWYDQNTSQDHRFYVFGWWAETP